MDDDDRHEVRQLGTDLHTLRLSVGAPSYQRLHRILRPHTKNLVSPNTLRNAEHGQWLPALSTLLQYVTGCYLVAREDGVVVESAAFELVQWQSRWLEIKASVRLNYLPASAQIHRKAIPSEHRLLSPEIIAPHPEEINPQKGWIASSSCDCGLSPSCPNGLKN